MMNMIFGRRFHRLGLTASVSLGAIACAGGRSATTAAPSLERPHHLAEAVDQFVDVDGFRIRYREIGRGEPVVLLHGRSSSLDAWHWMADSLASEYRVVAIDFRGAGLSTKSGDPLKYGPAMGNDVIGVMDHLHITRAHLVGHSLGAVIAAYVAAHQPERVATLSLLAGALFPDSASVAAITEPYVHALERGGDLRAYYRSRGASDSLAAQLSARLLAGNDVPSLIAATRGAIGLVLPRQLIDRNVIPTLIAVGTRDDLLEPDRQFASRWPRARFVEVTGADHGEVIHRAETLRAIREQLRRAKAEVRASRG